MMVHTYDPSIREARQKDHCNGKDQPGLYRETLYVRVSQNPASYSVCVGKTLLAELRWNLKTDSKN